MSTARYTFLGRLLLSLGLWFFVLGPFFAGLVLGEAGLLEGAFWTVFFVFVFASPLVLLGAAVLDRVRGPRTIETHGQFALGEPERNLGFFTKLDRDAIVLAPEDFSHEVGSIKASVEGLIPRFGQRFEGSQDILLLFHDAVGNPVAIVRGVEDVWRWRTTRGIGVFAVETREIQFQM